MIVSFDGDSLEEIVGAMRAFLAVIERSPAGTMPATAGGAYVGPALPACPVHLVEMAYTPAGTRRGNGGRYSASYRCPRPGCRELVWLGGDEQRGFAGRRGSRR